MSIAKLTTHALYTTTSFWCRLLLLFVVLVPQDRQSFNYKETGINLCGMPVLVIATETA